MTALLQRPQAVLPEGRRRSRTDRSSSTSSRTSGATSAARRRRQRRDRPGEGRPRPASPSCRPAEQRVRLRPRDRQAARHLRARTSSSAYHISVWGTGDDIALSNPPDATVDALAGARRELLQVAGRQLRHRLRRVQRSRLRRSTSIVYGDGGAPGGTPRTSPATRASSSGFSAAAGKRIVMWQIPLGNTKMRAQNNTCGPLPGQPRRVAARRGGPHAPDGLP